MLNLLRFVLQCLIALLLLSSVIGVFAAGPGTAEKITLGVFGAALIYAATRLRRLGPASS